MKKGEKLTNSFFFIPSPFSFQTAGIVIARLAHNYSLLYQKQSLLIFREETKAKNKKENLWTQSNC